MKIKDKTVLKWCQLFSVPGHKFNRLWLLNINCLSAGGAKWATLPLVGQTGHHQWATRVRRILFRSVSVFLMDMLLECDRVLLESGFRRTQRGQRQATATCWSFSGITCSTRWQKLGRLGSTSATLSPASTKSVFLLEFFQFCEVAYFQNIRFWLHIHLHLPNSCRVWMKSRSAIGLLC